MPLQIDSFLFILRLLLVILLYLFLMQVVIAITRDLRKTAANSDGTAKSQRVLGHLVVIDSGSTNLSPGMSFDLEPQTNIGRGPTNVIQIPDNSISAEHTRIWLRNGTWYVQDAGSKNGTYVNNMPAREALPARAGDLVSVGPIQFKLTQ